MLKALLWRTSLRLAGRLPTGLRSGLGKVCRHAAACRRPEDALRELLTARDDLDACLDRAAIAHGNGLHPKHRLMDYHRFFTDRIRAGDRVLDIGCGTGAVALSLASRGALVTAIDCNPDAIRIARRTHTHPNLTYLEGDATRDLPRRPFDAVVLSNVLEHIEQRIEFLRQIDARTTPDRWLIRVPMINRDWIVPLKRELGLFAYSDPTHCIEYDEDGFRGELGVAGLTIRRLQINWGELWAEAGHDD